MLPLMVQSSDGVLLEDVLTPVAFREDPAAFIQAAQRPTFASRADASAI